MVKAAHHFFITICAASGSGGMEINMKPKVIIIGSSGHAKVIIDTIKHTNNYEIVGCTDVNTCKNNVLDVPIIGDDSVLPSILSKGVKHAFIAIGDNKVRAKLFAIAQGIGFELINVISPYAYISPTVNLGRGIAVMPGAVINADAVIRDNVIVNTGATIDHDCVIDENAHIAPGCTLAGNVKIGKGVFLGAGSKVIPNIDIGDWSILGAGSVVIDNICSNMTAVGVPAKIIKF